MKVFISHSWKNKTVAQKIADEIKAAGSEVWLDANNLLPGQMIQPPDAAGTPPGTAEVVLKQEFFNNVLTK